MAERRELGGRLPQTPCAARPPQESCVTPCAGADNKATGPQSPIPHGTPSPILPSSPRDGPEVSADVQDVVSHQQTFLTSSDGGFGCSPNCSDCPALRRLCRQAALAHRQAGHEVTWVPSPALFPCHDLEPVAHPFCPSVSPSELRWVRVPPNPDWPSLGTPNSLGTSVSPFLQSTAEKPPRGEVEGGSVGRDIPTSSSYSGDLLAGHACAP